MKDFSSNHYEGAFEHWLIDNNIRYIAIDERKRAAFARCKVKSFDFLLYPRKDQVIIAEVKGRRFKGTSLGKLTGLECWVTTEDIDGLVKWQEVFGLCHQVVFVFTYEIELVDVDFDGRAVYDYAQKRYMFFCIKLDDYRSYMKVRSPKWQTLTLPADRFRQCAVELSEFLV
jgi:hypothetical protein